MIQGLGWEELDGRLASGWKSDRAYNVGGLPLRVYYRVPSSAAFGVTTVEYPLSVFTRRGFVASGRSLSNPEGDWVNAAETQGNQAPMFNIDVLPSTGQTSRWTVAVPNRFCYPRYVKTRRTPVSRLEDPNACSTDDDGNMVFPAIRFGGISDVWTQLRSSQQHGSLYTTQEPCLRGKVRVASNDLEDGQPGSPNVTVWRLESTDLALGVTTTVTFFSRIVLKNGVWVPWTPTRPHPPPSGPGVGSGPSANL
ncbi:hypothetical protein JCM11491_006237 [Sporobolomyces phaffii]